MTDFAEWLQVGIDQGWVSDTFCAMHNGILTNDTEDEEMDKDWEPCLPCIRVWQDEIC